MVGMIKVLNYKENEDGTATVEFDLDEESQKYLFDVAMQVILLCGSYNVTVDKVIENIIEVFGESDS